MDNGEEGIGRQSAPILNGTVLTSEGSGHVQAPNCSGELLFNDWVLSARHCFGANTDPTTISYKMGQQTRTADRIILQPGDFYHDAAVVHLSQPFTMNGSTTGYSLPLYNGTTASLIGKQVTCYGYGPGTVNGPFDGTLRSMTSTVGGSVPDALTFYIAMNGAGQTCLPGDSGGSCLYNGQQVGIAREAWNNGPGGGPGTCDWTTTTTDGARAWILSAVAKTVPVAFQANTNYLWLDQNGSGTNTYYGMMAGTVPSLAMLQNGQPAVAFQANSGVLWLDLLGVGATNTGLGMKAGTSPSIAVLPSGQVAAAFQANTGVLWLSLNNAASAINTGLGMKAGTSPSIAVLPNGQVAAAFQANSGVLWLSLNNAASATNTGLGMKAGTSPSIAVLPNGEIAVAFEANTGDLWLYQNGTAANTGYGMMAGTSPSIAILDGKIAMAFQANTGSLWVYQNGAAKDERLGMKNTASPSIVPIPRGGYQVAFEANTGDLWLDVNGIGTNQWLGMNTP